MMPRTGHCMCGAVSVTVSAVPDHMHACHCETCRRNSGSVSLSVTVPHEAVTVSGAEHVRTYASSDWAARSFCGRCGSALWYRLTEPDAATADYYLSAGMLDDLSGITLTQEIFIDRKPAGYAFAGVPEQLTEDQFLASLANPKE